MNKEELNQMENLVNNMAGIDPSRVKKIKSDKGLIERTESSKIILTEDNRQILTD